MGTNRPRERPGTQQDHHTRRFPGHPTSCASLPGPSARNKPALEAFLPPLGSETSPNGHTSFSMRLISQKVLSEQS